MTEEKNHADVMAGGMPGVLLAAAECVPFAETGGLANLVGSLPAALRSSGTEARVIMPFHRCIKEKYGSRTEHLFSFYARLGWRREYVGIERLVFRGTTFYFVDNEHYFGDRMYRGGTEEGEQYAYFTRAVLDALPNLGFKPDIVHCNDWQTAMIPMLAHTQYRGLLQDRIKYLLTIHNLAYQGRFRFDFVQDLLSVDACYMTPDGLELNGQADFLKAGCLFADRINTVSKSYAAEIRTPAFGEGLDGFLNTRGERITGILNRIDRSDSDPAADPALPAHLDFAHRANKAVCKQALQQAMGLEQRSDVPLFAMVTRLTEQKGLDLVLCVLDEMLSRDDMQLMILGSGEEHYEKFLAAAEKRYPGRLCAYIGYQDELARLVYAGSDFYLLPSRFEPCGLGQMIAMRYGSVPIVRETGGLRDTVVPYNRFSDGGDGFSFINFDAWEMRDAMRLAMACYKDREIMDGLTGRAMRKNFGIEHCAGEYVRLYQWML